MRFFCKHSFIPSPSREADINLQRSFFPLHTTRKKNNLWLDNDFSLQIFAEIFFFFFPFSPHLDPKKLRGLLIFWQLKCQQF